MASSLGFRAVLKEGFQTGETRLEIATGTEDWLQRPPEIKPERSILCGSSTPSEMKLRGLEKYRILTDAFPIMAQTRALPIPDENNKFPSSDERKELELLVFIAVLKAQDQSNI
jgi:hypothetical protein